ncbi:MAG: amidohydrolase family protein [Chloroflexi bacterium]|nr:amidohydrolase family protein [Chloroflexota bacterium]
MTTAITNATLIDGTGADPVPNATVLIEGERITGAGANASLPSDADVIDAGGRTVMPGMIDCHVHLWGRVTHLQERLLTPPTLNAFYAMRNAQRTLDAGVTSVRDASGSPMGLKMAIERGLIPGPRMRLSVSALSQTGGHGDGTMPSGADPGGIADGRGPEWPGRVVEGPEGVRLAVRKLLRAGADFIKLCSTGGVLSPTDEPGHTQFTPDEIAVMVYEAKTQGKTCMSHAQGTQGILNAVLAGVESIEHGIYVDDRCIDEMKARGTYLVPTLVAPVWVLRHAERMPGAILPQSVRKTKEVMEDHKRNIGEAIRAGVKVAMGTDSGVGHHGSNAEELQLMVEAGMTPMQAIVATTRTASECIHMANDIGTIAPGKYADLLVVDGDPLADITVLQDKARLALIMQGGRAHKNTM